MTDIHTVGIIGLGRMGSGIAEVLLLAGLHIVASETTDEQLAAGRTRLQVSLDRAAGRSRVTEAEAAAALARVTWTTSLGSLADCDLVIEAATENVEAKLAIFRALGEIVSQDAVLASNTSSIPLTDLAAVVPSPGRVVGLHFFNPAPVMALVEVVSATRSDPAVLESTVAFVERTLGKTAIVVPDRAGFVVNALLIPYLLSAIRMLESGRASAQDIDTGMRLGCGHPMGPLELADLIGLDVVLAAADSMYEEYREPAYAPPPLLRREVSAGRLGRKSGHGLVAAKGRANDALE